MILEFLVFFSNFGVFKVKNQGFGVIDISPNHKDEDFVVFRKVTVLGYECSLNKNICTELVGFPVF